MKNLKHLLIILLSVLTIASTSASDMNGTWDGKSYSISMSDTFEYIRGNWGDEQIDLRVSKTFEYLRGSIGSDAVDLSFSKTFSYVRGELPCGKMDYSYSSSFGYVRGINCGLDFNINLGSDTDAAYTAEEVYMDSLLNDFPLPVRSAVKRFIRSRIEL